MAARTFAAIHAEGVSVSTIFQSSSESSIGFTLPGVEADRAVAALQAAFREELEAGLVDGVSARHGVAVIAVVGRGMAGAPGVAARVFSALSASRHQRDRDRAGLVGAQHLLRRRRGQAAEAARRVHTAFQLVKIGGGRPPGRSTDVVLLGFGRVSRALAEDGGGAPATGGSGSWPRSTARATCSTRAACRADGC